MAEQLRGLLGDDRAHHVVGWEVLPYDATSPPKAIASDRIAALAKLRAGHKGAYVTAVADALLPCMPPKVLAGKAFSLAVGDTLDTVRTSASLSAAGCASVDRVRAPGEFAVYGGQFDVWPGGHNVPIRVVLDLDRVAQIRAFDPSTQLSTGRMSRVEVLPAREYPLDDESVVAVRGRWRERFSADLDDGVYESVSRGLEAEGAEFYLPLFYGTSHSLFDHVRHSDVFWLGEGFREGLDAFGALVSDRHDQAQSAGLAALPPGELFLSAAEFMDRLGRHASIEVRPDGDAASEDMGAHALPPVGIRRDSSRPYGNLASWVKGRRGRTVFTWHGKARKERVLAALSAVGVKAARSHGLTGRAQGAFLCEGPYSGGFDCGQGELAVVTEAELHDFVPAPRMVRSGAAAMAELDDMSPGELAVHSEHGVARYLGLEQIESDGYEDEFIHLEFANGVRLFVTVDHCHLVTRYRHPEPDEQVRLHELGGKRWRRSRQKAEKVARDTAARLLDIYAKRDAAAKGMRPLRLDEGAYASFCAAFEHVETADQSRATAEIVADVVGARPMDRLLCGDVGFGKTEVAMRAAWVAWSVGRQVAVVAPTTLLADQLHRNFTERFAGSGADVLELSTMVGGKEAARTLERLASGEPSIVVGTHSLLGAKVSMPNLGLAIIDEEHRFGVRQKERLREMRAGVDVLALSATPIPRTMSMALEGVRDLSLVATPPSDRLAVRTFVTVDMDSVVREAIARETARGGQVFYVHHRVQTIGLAEERVRDLAPEARVGVAHGQMPHASLDAAMRGYYRGDVDVLVCTTIVESGLDVPNANTVIVPRADHFGAAQLHQLRGRVGRSARQGYAYFLTAGETVRNKKSRVRLETLSDTAFLGSGYELAVRDMEIRGAGELLGDAQSGVVTDVGFESFKRMLQAAVRATQGRGVAPECDVDFGGHARLPAGYCASPVERMRCYRRLAAAESEGELEGMRELLADRFGPLPMPARLLVESHHLRLAASTLGVTEVKDMHDGVRFTFTDSPACADRLVEVSSSRGDCTLIPGNGLRLTGKDDVESRMRHAIELCAELADGAERGRRKLVG